jgi:RNA polymerase sigma-70 factor (ECF subfamily)
MNNLHYSHYTDAELWQAYKEGNDDAYGYIYHKYAPGLYNYGRHIVKDRQLVEDCLHDLFVHLHQHRATLGATDSIKYYLFRSLRRRIAEANRAQTRFVDTLDNTTAPASAIPSSEFQYLESETDQLQQNHLMKALQQLPARQKESIYLIYFDGLSYKEVASIMSVEVRTVYNQVHNALETLKKLFKKFPMCVFLALLIPIG